MKSFLKWAGIVVAGLFVIGIFAGGGKKDGGKESAPPESATSKQQKEIINISSVELFKSYEENEVATDERLKGKVVQVSGTVQAIDKDAFDNIIVNFSTQNEFMPTHMKMGDTEKQAAIELKKGKKTTIQCQKMARIMGSPYGSECVFIAGS